MREVPGAGGSFEPEGAPLRRQLLGCGGCHAKPAPCGSDAAGCTLCTLHSPPLVNLPGGEALELRVKSCDRLYWAWLIYLAPLVGLLLAALFLEQLGLHEGWIVSGSVLVAFNSWLGVRLVVVHRIKQICC